MSEQLQIYIDRNSYTYLQYRDSGKVRHFVTLRSGSIECIQLTAKDFMRLRKYDKKSPADFAKTYLSSFLPISRQARVVLRGILGQAEGDMPPERGSSFTGGTVGIQEIAEANQWEPSKCRKFLRKMIEKPGGRWEWSPEEAQKIEAMLRECFANE